MIKVVRVNKTGNKIDSYTCTDGNRSINLTKEQLIAYINNKQVTNARLQVYNGTSIIRLKDDDITERINRKASCGSIPGTKETEPCISRGFTIQDYIDEQRAAGKRTLDFGDILVDTVTLQVTYKSKPQEVVIETPMGTVNNTEDKVKSIIRKSIKDGAYLFTKHGKYGVARGEFEEKSGLYVIDTHSGVCRPIKSFRSRYNVIIETNDYVVAFDFNALGCEVEVFRITPNGAIGCPFKELIDEFSGKHTIITKLNDRFIMINDIGKIAVLDLHKMILSISGRDI